MAVNDVNRSEPRPPAGGAHRAAGAPARHANVANPLAGMPSPHVRRFRAMRGDISAWQAALLGAACIAVCFVVWWALTSAWEDRIISAVVLPSPGETFSGLPGLWFDRELTRNTVVSLRRVVLGFGLAAAVGIPLGVLCGCFRRISAFFAPVMIVGRNIPVAAVIPLTFSLFGIGEFQKIMFIFVACVAFIVLDTATAVAAVSHRYVDTAYTLGARRRQIIVKVLVPLAMPGIFNSLRLLFGLAFGYIMLTEIVRGASDPGGLGSIISNAQRRSNPGDILLILMLIPLVALAIDRLLFWVQRQLFPYQYGGSGLLHQGVRSLCRTWEDMKAIFCKPVEAADDKAATAGRAEVQKPS